MTTKINAKELLEGTTQGPWKCSPSKKDNSEYAVWDEDGNYLTLNDEKHEANARLIAAAPALAAEVVRLQKRVEELEYVLGRIAEERDAGRHDGLPEVSPVLSEQEMCELAQAALAAKHEGE